MFNINLGHPLCAIAQLYVLVLFARAILSWFPIRSDSPLLPIVRALHTLTEPVLAPARRIIPPAGMFDLSFLVVILLFQIVIVNFVCNVLRF
ncbi:MAG TPA: YggT family protein [Acidimicrobiales bacterium]|nr:YggT family protein [Acidimicrobiales bacterium]